MDFRQKMLCYLRKLEVNYHVSHYVPDESSVYV